MFARASQKKQEGKKKAIPSKTTRKTVFSSIRINVQQPAQTSFNKIASIRTLPPFAYINSESGTNSQRKSVEDSQTNSEIWRQDSELFESDHKHSIKTIDKQLEEVLDTIKKERNLIDMKIWKLRAKLQEAQNKNHKERMVQSVTVATSTMDQQIPRSLNRSQQNETGTQFPDLPSYSTYFRQLVSSLGLRSIEGNVVGQGEEIDDQTKIRENKMALKMLFDEFVTP